MADRPYSVTAYELGDLCGELVDQARERDPLLDNIKFEYEDGAVVSLKLKGKPPKRHPTQVGPTVTETRPSGFYELREELAALKRLHDNPLLGSVRDSIAAGEARSSGEFAAVYRDLLALLGGAS